MSSELRGDGLLGHGEVLEGLWRAAADRRLPHALLFHGPEGVGKFLAARRLAAGLLCAQGPGAPCEACGPCKRLGSGNHPDLMEVDAVASGQDVLGVAFITPRDVRPKGGYDGPSIGVFLSLKPMVGGWRVALVREVERMNDAAQNAFLKTLEEPGEATLLVLETSNAARLLATIQSRVVEVPLGPLDEDETRRVLERSGLEAASAAEVGRWSGGAPGRGLLLAQRAAPAMREALATLARGEQGVAAAAERIWQLEGSFPAKTAAGQRRLRAATLLDVGLELWLDGERAAAGVPLADLVHGEVLATLPPLAAADRERRLEAWFQARQDVALNLGPEALVDRALAAAAPGA